MFLNPAYKKLDLKQPYIWLATWFGVGFIAKAPGTWGSLAALPFGMIVFSFAGTSGLIVFTIIATLLGLWSAGRFEKASGMKDSQMIVIDEVAGQSIALLPALSLAQFHPLWVLLAFTFFRLFDITKPWPVSWADRKLSGALGIMLDDIIAGLMAAICLMGLRYYA